MTERGVGFTERLRVAARVLGDGEKVFSAADLSHQAGLGSYKESRKMHCLLKDLKKSGELVTVSRGKYRWVERGGKANHPTKQEVMWRFLRMNRVVTIADLMETSSVSASFARQWMRMLIKNEVVKVIDSGKYQLIKDGLENPKDIEKAAKLRELRARKKDAMVQSFARARGSMLTMSSGFDSVKDVTNETIEAIGAGLNSIKTSLFSLSKLVEMGMRDLGEAETAFHEYTSGAAHEA